MTGHKSLFDVRDKVGCVDQEPLGSGAHTPVPKAGVYRFAMQLPRRLRLALAYRIWPWRVPAKVVDLAGMSRPPERVFEHFRRLHGGDNDA